MNDFSSPRRMSAGAFVILLQKSFREIAGACFVLLGYVLYDSYDSSLWESFLKLIASIGAILGLSLLVAFSKYYFRKFHIENDKLIYTHGFAARQTTSIPLSRVHTLRTKKGLLYRLLDLRGISFDTLASENEEAELILDEKDWQKLLHRIRVGEDFPDLADSTVALPPLLTDSTQKVSNLNIIKGALCQNHLKGFAVLGAIAMALYDIVSKLGDETTEEALSYVEERMGDGMPSAGECVLIGAALYVIVMLLWTGKIFLRYSGMSIRLGENRMTIESGLVSRFTCRVAREKTTELIIKQNPLERLAGCETITVNQADNVTDTRKERNIRIYGSDLGGLLLSWWLDNAGADAGSPLMSGKSGKGLFLRKFIPHLVLAIAVSAIIICTRQIVVPTVIIGTAYVAIMGVRAVMAQKHGGIELHETYVRINCGNIAAIRKYIKYRDIETVSLRSTPFTRYSGRVSLKISTNAGLSTVYALDSPRAAAIRNALLNKAESNKCGNPCGLPHSD